MFGGFKITNNEVLYAENAIFDKFIGNNSALSQ